MLGNNEMFYFKHISVHTRFYNDIIMTSFGEDLYLSVHIIMPDELTLKLTIYNYYLYGYTDFLVLEIHARYFLTVYLSASDFVYGVWR